MSINVIPWDESLPFMTRALILLLALLVTACASGPSITTDAAMPVVQNIPLPAPSQAETPIDLPSYQIGPLDRLSVSVFGVPELTREDIQTDAGGYLSYPLVGPILAAGLTPAELEAFIEGRLRESFVRNPQVTVNLRETVSHIMTVDGQVTRPGLYPVIGKMTLMRAVASAGGLSEFADLEDVIIFRTVGGQRMAGVYNMKAIRAGTYDDPLVYARDIIVVGNSEQRRLFRDLIQASSLLTTPLLLLFNNNN